MYLSQSCLAEAYCQDAYAADNHDVIAEAFCRAIKTHDPKKGDFKTWVGIQRSGVVREDQRLRRRVGYLEETCAANKEGGINEREECGGSSFARLGHPRSDFLTSPKALFNTLVRREQKRIVKGLLRSLGKRSRLIIMKRFYRDETMIEIANEFGVSDSTIDREEKKTLRFFREKLAKKNIALHDILV